MLHITPVILFLVLHLFENSAFAYGHHGHWGSSHNHDLPRSYYSRRNYYSHRNYDYDDYDEPIHYQQKTSCNCVKLSECRRGISKIASDNFGYKSNDYYHYHLARLTCGYINDELAVCCQTTNLKQKPSRKRVKKPNLNSTEKSAESNNDFNQMELTLPNSMKNFCPSAISAEFELDENHKFHRESDDEEKFTIEPRLVEETSTMTTTIQLSEAETTTMMSNIWRTIQGNLNLDELSNSNLINNEQCGRTLSQRISGGEDAGIGDFPWMARIAYRNKTSRKLSFRCGGTLISNRYVLTVAHCVSNLIKVLEVSYVRLGDLDSTRENECNENGLCLQEADFEIERIIVHPNYNQPLYSNDIALIKLSQPARASDTFRPICLPVGDYKENSTSEGDNAIVAGFGITSSSSPIDQATRLQWIRLPFVDIDFCASFYYNYTMNTSSMINITNSQLCVQGRVNGDACSGDSGGPLMTDSNSSERYVLYGLVSFGPRRCGLSNFPSVYTRVSSYMEWIIKNIES